MEKDSFGSIYTRNLRFRAAEMFKVLAPTIINDLFPLKKTNNYNLRRKLFFKIPRNETVRNGFESISTRVRARSLVVSDLRSVTKGSRFESGCQLCAEVSSLQQSPG